MQITIADLKWSSRLNIMVYTEFTSSKIEEEHVINDDLAGMHIMITSYSPFMTRVFDRIEVFL
ncbi:MAG: hypothetical protein QW052_04040 [Candidatus Nitrosocaldaceae archaeon]